MVEYNPFQSFEEAVRGGCDDLDLLERDGEERTVLSSFVPVESIPDPSDIFNTYDSIAGRVFKEKQRLRKMAIRKEVKVNGT